MARILKDIDSLYIFLKGKFEDRLEIIELDGDETLLGTLDDRIFIISYIPKKSLLISCKPESREMLDEFEPLLINALGGNKTYSMYDYQKKGLKRKEAEPTLDWNLANKESKFKIMASIKLKPGEKIHHFSCSIRGVHMTPIRFEVPFYKPCYLRGKARLSEETLILLEQRFAKKASETEIMLAKSEYRAAHMMPCMNDGNEDKGKPYTKTK